MIPSRPVLTLPNKARLLLARASAATSRAAAHEQVQLQRFARQLDAALVGVRIAGPESVQWCATYRDAIDYVFVELA